MAKCNYATTVGIHLGETSRAKESFLLEVLEILMKIDSDKIWSTTDDIWEVTGWECPVDYNSIYALCQLHEEYLDEK